MELVKNGAVAKLLETGAIVKTAFCGPCFGAGDTPANNAFSIRHSTRNFPNREGSKVQNGQISSVALMDARSIAATAANKGFLTSAADIDVNFTKPKYFFDKTIYENRVFDSHGVADPSVEIQFGPNIKDWPAMSALPENMLLKVVSEIHDPVTTTDELIPSGETSSYRSNPLGLAEFALSRKDPEYVGRAKEIQKAQKAIESGECAGKAVPEVAEIMGVVKKNSLRQAMRIWASEVQFLLLSRVTAQQESRLPAARRYSEAGQISQTSMPQRDIVQTLSTGECFHSSSMRESFRSTISTISSFRESRRK